MLLGFVVVIMGITIFQEQKTENTLEAAARSLPVPGPSSSRDGERRRIAGREVVTDDLIVLAEGDRVPADAVLLWGVNFAVDESLLTGESAAVRKNAGGFFARQCKGPGGRTRLLSIPGTLVVHGQGVRRGEGHGCGVGDRAASARPCRRWSRSRLPAAPRRAPLSARFFLGALVLCAPSW